MNINQLEKMSKADQKRIYDLYNTMVEMSKTQDKIKRTKDPEKKKTSSRKKGT